MPILILMILAMALTIPALISVIDDSMKARWRLLWIALWLGAIGWMIGGATRPYKVDKEEVLDYSETMLPNGTAVQVLHYIDRDGKPQSINLNERFKTRLTIAAKVKRSQHAPGNYCGINYDGTVFVQDKFEIVCPMLDKKKKQEE